MTTASAACPLEAHRSCLTAPPRINPSSRVRRAGRAPQTSAATASGSRTRTSRLAPLLSSGINFWDAAPARTPRCGARTARPVSVRARS
jgi:hypothetical protein